MTYSSHLRSWIMYRMFFSYDSWLYLKPYGFRAIGHNRRKDKKLSWWDDHYTTKTYCFRSVSTLTWKLLQSYIQYIYIYEFRWDHSYTAYVSAYTYQFCAKCRDCKSSYWKLLRTDHWQHQTSARSVLCCQVQTFSKQEKARLRSTDIMRCRKCFHPLEVTICSLKGTEVA